MRVLTIFLILLLVLSSCGKIDSETPKKDDRTVIRFSHVVKRDTPKGMGAQMLKRLVEEDREISKKVRVEVYPEAVLYNDEDIIEKLLANKVQLAAPSFSILCNKSKDIPSLCAFDKFYKFPDLTAVTKFQNDNKILEFVKGICSETGNPKNCLIGLGYWHNGMKQLSIKKKCKDNFSKEDLKGLTFRIQGSDTIEKEFKENFSAKVKHIPFTETYKALKDGKVDGQENTWSNILSDEYDRVQDCFIETNHGYLGYIVLTNQTFWGNLDKSLQDNLKNKLDEVTRKVNETAERYNANARRRIEKEKPTSIVQFKRE